MTFSSPILFLLSKVQIAVSVGQGSVSPPLSLVQRFRYIDCNVQSTTLMAPLLKGGQLQRSRMSMEAGLVPFITTKDLKWPT